MDLHANRMIFADDKYCRAAMPLAIPGGIAHNHRMFNLDVIPARRPESNRWGSSSTVDLPNKQAARRRLSLVWRPHGDSNPGYRRERAMS